MIITAEGRAVLIDFGIARTYKQNAKKDTAFSGTNDFAPPEQYGYSQTDARADVFSLGMLLEFDREGDLRPEQPFTLREAALSVLRLYESAGK